LVVIAIIGVLASIVLASLNSARRKSRDARRITDIKQIQLALELYYDGQSPTPQYPEVKPDCPNEAYGLKALSDGGYIPQVPRDPNASPNCYRYTANTGTRTTYHLGATLEETTNPALNSDKDCNSITNSPVCMTGASYGPTGTPFDGTAATMYDVIP
jgi:type II secretory pathway pseudopilin PulG